jgi:arylformamidase
MLIHVSHNEKKYSVDLASGIDISIPLIEEGPNCFHAPHYEASPLVSGNFIGDTTKGSPVNFYNIKLNPHGNGTHTESVGHISKERISINQCLKKVHYFASIISIYPQQDASGDRIITLQQIVDCLEHLEPTDVLIVRTLPNHEDKLTRNYSGTNPPYFHHEAIQYIVDKGYIHLVVDLPSIDREEDGGAMLGHKAFWDYPEKLDLEKTITEMVFVPNFVKDGIYFVNFQIPPFEIDAASSRLFLYLLNEV